MAQGIALGRSDVVTPVRAPRSAAVHEVDFVKLDPTQNMTLLVRTDHPQEAHLGIARQIMAYQHVHAEQVGFVVRPTAPGADVGLRMAGGEFCGNACMALAALVAAERGLGGGGVLDLALEVRGTDGLVRCRVLRHADEYVCETAMPVPLALEPAVAPGGWGGDCAFVRYSDSLHVVVETARLDAAARREAESAAVRLGAERAVSLVGVMLYDPDHGSLTPLVHVPLLGTTVWERGCGSGAAALGAYLAWKNRASVTTRVVQPGGAVRVSAHHARTGVTGVEVEGTVRIVAEGKAYLHSVEAVR